MTCRDIDSCATQLRILAVKVVGIICNGCGHEHSCSAHGCAILRQAADKLENLHREVAAQAEIIEKQAALGGRVADLALALDRVTAERDMLLSSLKDGGCSCDVCFVNGATPVDCSGECDVCSIPCPCRTCGKDYSNFKLKAISEV